MRVAGGKKSSVGEWVVICLLVVSAIAVTEFVGLRQKWEYAIVRTVIIFSSVIVAFRPAWGRSAFWKTLVPIFLLHIVAVVVILQSLPPSSSGPHGLVFTAATALYVLLIAGVLWKRSVRSKSDLP